MLAAYMTGRMSLLWSRSQAGCAAGAWTEQSQGKVRQGEHPVQLAEVMRTRPARWQGRHAESLDVSKEERSVRQAWPQALPLLRVMLNLIPGPLCT